MSATRVLFSQPVKYALLPHAVGAVLYAALIPPCSIIESCEISVLPILRVGISIFDLAPSPSHVRFDCGVTS